MKSFSNPFKAIENEILVDKEEGSTMINFNNVLFMGKMNHALISEKSKDNIYTFLLTRDYLYYLKEKPIKNKSNVKVVYKGKIKIGFVFISLKKIKVKEDKTNYYLKLTRAFKKVLFKIELERDALHWEKIMAPYMLNKNFLHRFENLNLIGFGSFSAVYRVRDKVTKEIFACKRVKLKGLDSVGVEKLTREIEILRMLRGHENILKLHYVFKGESSVYIVTELCQGGQLVKSSNLLDKKELKQIANIFLHLLSFLEKEGIVIGNLFEQKILLKEKAIGLDKNTVKLVNFNMARKADRSEKVFTHKRDIFRFGELLFMGIMGRSRLHIESSLLEDYDGCSSKIDIYKKMLKGNESKSWLISGGFNIYDVNSK